MIGRISDQSAVEGVQSDTIVGVNDPRHNLVLHFLYVLDQERRFGI
jgi:hypothetical protein